MEPDVFHAPINSPKYNHLIPTLKDGDVIIMDNMRSHHAKKFAETVSRTNKDLTILYLPPHSPDFNPIEMMWSKIDAIKNKGYCRSTFCY